MRKGHRHIPRGFKAMIEEVMEEFGIEDWHYATGRKHGAVVFTAGGRVHRHTVAGSPSDNRSFMNCRADLRRLCRQQPDPAAVDSHRGVRAVGPSVSPGRHTNHQQR